MYHWCDVNVLTSIHPMCRSEIQCREKWGGSLDPTVNAAPYSSEEDARLRSVVAALQRGAEGKDNVIPAVHCVTRLSVVK